MHVGLELTPEEFSKLHNAICHISNSADHVAATGLKEGKRLQAEVEVIRALLKPAYDADHKVFEQRNLHYRLMGNAIGAKTSWSMYEIEHLGNTHPYEGAKTVTHQSHWGDNIPEVAIEGSGTYLDLFKAADKAIRESGDLHHCYIEGFNHTGDTLVLITGS